MGYPFFFRRTLSFLTICLVCFCGNAVFAQYVSEYPSQYFSIYQNQVLFTSAPVLSGERGAVALLYQGRNGPFSDVNAVVFSGNLLLKKRHMLGAFVTTENESEFLRKSRYYARYAFKIQLSSSVKVIAGAMAGVASYQFNAASAGTSGADTRFDAAMGVSLVTGKFSAGVHLWQIPQARVRPLLFDYYLKRYVTLMARYRHALTDHADFLYLAECSIYQDRDMLAKISLAADVYKKVLAGIQADRQGNASFYGGLRIPFQETRDVQLQFHYVLQNLLNKNGHRLNVYEISSVLNF